MGVQGLTTCIEKHRQIYRDVRFKKRRLVIDGCNVLYLLYFDSGLDQNHGGDYAAFEDLVGRFFKALSVCGVSPYVVLDGGADPSHKKAETLEQRAEDRIYRATRVTVDGGSRNVLPQLAKLVFRQTLCRLGVPVAQCYAEADQEIAALANAWECPVLSSDSDFYVFFLREGLLPLAHFRWQAVEQPGAQSFIPCSFYKASSFCTFFNLQQRLLPAFAALAGNDYVKLQKMEAPIRWADFSPGGGGTRLEGLLCWLKAFQGPQQALEAAMALMGELSAERKAEVQDSLTLGMEEYDLPPSVLDSFFTKGAAPPLPAEEEATAPVPDWLRLAVTQALLTPDVLDVLRLKSMSLGCPVASADLPSAYLASRPLRQVMYGLLLGKGRQVQVNESDRDGLQLVQVPVQPASRGVARQLQLGSLNQADPSQRLQVLLEALGVKEAPLTRLPEELRLPVAVTHYWLQRTQPPDHRLLKALLLLWTSNRGETRHRAALLQKQNPQKLDVNMAHAFSQWQACLKDAVHLNQLLCFPLPEPQIARLYEGTAVHSLVHLMRTRHYRRAQVQQYKIMVGVLHQLQAQAAAAVEASASQALSPRRRRRQTQAMADLPINMEQLLSLYEDKEGGGGRDEVEDLPLDDMVLVRTRYRAKERMNRCNNPELTRKEERRGVHIL